MKKLLSAIIAAACMLTFPAAAFAGTENSVGAELVQTFAEENGDPLSILEIRTIGEAENKEAAVSVPYLKKDSLTEIVIPEIINGYKIVAVDNQGFKDCKNLIKVTLPETINTLDDYSFYGCENLVSINIPEGVTDIGSSAFYNCYKLESITLPKGIKTIKPLTFFYCVSLKSIVIPEGVTELQRNAFSMCSNAESLTLPNTLETINENAFSGCGHLVSIIIPDSVKNIKKGAFSNCFRLESITIPSNVEELGESAFEECLHLKEVVINNGITKIPRFCFRKCKELETVYLPRSIELIESDAFYYIEYIKNVYYSGSEKQWEEVLVEKGNLFSKAEFHFLDSDPVCINLTIPKQDENLKINDLKASALDTSSGNTVELEVDEANGIDVTALENGTYTLTVGAKQCAERSYSLTVSGDGLSGEAAGGVEIHLYGDADGDGIIKVTDVAKANSYVKGDKSMLTGYDLAVCDVNRDGKVNIQDVAKINAHIKQTVMLW